VAASALSLGQAGGRPDGQDHVETVSDQGIDMPRTSTELPHRPLLSSVGKVDKDHERFASSPGDVQGHRLHRP
jgi:hypothetical protein